MLSPNLNYVAIGASAVASMVLGFLWYSPILFGKPWMKLMGFTEKSMEKAKKSMGALYGVSFLGSLLMAYVLAYFIDYIGAVSVLEGVQVAFWAWLGFVATTMLTEVLFGGKPFKLYAINAAYQLVSMVVMGAILAVWI